MRKQGAASVSVVTLLDKVARRVVDLKPDYRGFEVESFLNSESSLGPACTALCNLICQACGNALTQSDIGNGLSRHTADLYAMPYAHMRSVSLP